jgi:hypothetical protein
MATARPLRDVFADLVGDPDASGTDPAELLREQGHDDLPDALVAEAVTSFADTAPIEVAEHLSPYVMANSAVPGVAGEVAPGAWLSTLAEAPAVTADPAGLDPDQPAGPDASPDGAGVAGPADDPFSLDFGGGTGEDPTSVAEPPAGPELATGVPDDLDTTPTTPDLGFDLAAPTGPLPDADGDGDTDADGPDDAGLA